MNTNNMINDRLAKLHTARLNIFLSDPFVGYILQNLEIQLSDTVLTACTDGTSITFGENFLDTLDLSETIFVLMHEVLHIILGHPFRSKGYDFFRFNVACDIVVNDIISSFGFDPGKLSGQFGYHYHVNGCESTAEEIYAILPKQIRTHTIDIHDLWEAIAVNASESDIVKIYRLIREAKSKGYYQSGLLMNRKIGSLVYSQNNNDWKHILEEYVVKALFDYSFMRIDQRFHDVLLPTYLESEEALKNVWFVLDVSGSMSEDLLAMIIGEIDRIVKHYKSIACDLSFFSNITTDPKRFTSSAEALELLEEAKTTGGTDFSAIFFKLRDYYRSNKPSLIIIFTDGKGLFPDPEAALRIPVIWVLDDRSQKSPFGKNIYIDN